MPCQVRDQNVLYIALKKYFWYLHDEIKKNAIGFGINEENAKLEKRRTATFNFSQIYTNINDMNIPVS
jgi:hypothetical protein